MTMNANEAATIKGSWQRRDALRGRLGPSLTTFEALTESIQQLQGLARDRLDASSADPARRRRNR